VSITTPRTSYAPMLYPEADKFCDLQNSVHWLPNEIPLGSDVDDWKRKLTEAERHAIGQILKGFVATEIFIEDYWAAKVSRWFKHPEIQGMAVTFAAFERIHAKSYARLNEELHLEDFEAFLHEPTAKAKIDRIMGVKGNSKPEIARSLAVFSAFNEGVNLFSSFAILMSFQQRNLLKGVGKIIEFSIRDESLHSEAGCWLFRQLVAEFPEIWTDELKAELYQAARDTVALEDDFIDKAFELGPVEGLDPHDLKNYIRFRANTKLADINLKTNWKKIDQDALNRMQWFDVLAQGVVSQDSFAGRVSDYGKAIVDFEDIYDD
jgi:ribonucleoside-diphosphate reductase beta chain